MIKLTSIFELSQGISKAIEKGGYVHSSEDAEWLDDVSRKAAMLADLAKRASEERRVMSAQQSAGRAEIIQEVLQ